MKAETMAEPTMFEQLLSVIGGHDDQGLIVKFLALQEEEDLR